MNLTMSVEMSLVLFLLCSGSSHFTFASNRLRVLRLSVNQETSWCNMSHECKEPHESYVTLYDEEDAEFTHSYVDNSKAWLGLHKGRHITWSNGEPFVQANDSPLDQATFTNIFGSVANGEQLCVAIGTTWNGFNCAERKPFMCNNGGNYTLINITKNWCQALQYCRILYDDLASINDKRQNENAIKEGKNTSFWIGLMFDEWEWEDGSCSSFRKWYLSPEGKDDPAIYTQSVQSFVGLSKIAMGVRGFSFCSKGNIRIKVINLNLTWEEAFNYCKANHSGLLWINDEDDQKAVEKWLNHTDVGGPFWIGLRQSHVFGFWIWRDRVVSYCNWKNGKVLELPEPGSAVYNHCGAIDKMDGKWSDEDCSDRKPFLCEEEIVFMNKSRMVNPSSWSSHP